MDKLIFFWMFFSLRVFALTVDPSLPISECIQKSDVIFYGKVKSHELIPPSKQGYGRKVTFEVLKTFKGPHLSSREIYFYKDFHRGSKNAPSGIFSPGVEVFIFTNEGEEPNATVECSGRGGRNLLNGEGERYSRCKLKALDAYVEGKSLKEVTDINSCPWPKDKK